MVVTLQNHSGIPTALHVSRGGGSACTKGGGVPFCHKECDTDMTMDRTPTRTRTARSSMSTTTAMRVLTDLAVKCFELRFPKTGGWQTGKSWHALPPRPCAAPPPPPRPPRLAQSISSAARRTLPSPGQPLGNTFAYVTHRPPAPSPQRRLPTERQDLCHSVTKNIPGPEAKEVCRSIKLR